jgi:hypothetical protein
MRIITLITFLLLTCINANSQNLIGYKSRDILKYMKENRKDMNIDKVINSKFKYLKYSDNSDSQTLLFFLDPDSICKNVRMICNSNLKPEKVKEFDSIYKKTGDNRWIDSRDGKDYRIEIKNEEWSCIVTIEPYK